MRMRVNKCRNKEFTKRDVVCVLSIFSTFVPYFLFSIAAQLSNNIFCQMSADFFSKMRFVLSEENEG
jgi:hypothetical protein